MNEVQRQSYLKTLGFTPWVARAPLPGAASTPWAEWPEVPESPATEVMPAEASRSVEGVSSQASPLSSVVADQAAVVPAALRDSSAASATPAKKVESTTATASRPAQPSMELTLQAYQVGSVWLLAEQEDAQAPDLGREAQQLLNNILTVLPGDRRGTRRFIWPISDIAIDDDALRKTFQSFARGLGGRILLCAEERSVEKMLGQSRYQPCGEAPMILPVSALSEMLENPAEHKRLTWNAMLAANFHA